MMPGRGALQRLLLLVSLTATAAQPPIVLSPALAARVFDSVGGISGGGATSRLLDDYPEPKRTQLYDILFAPQQVLAFGVVKVEIPADADTTNGAEVAHRHDEEDGGSCTRGYEGTFLAEANRRRPGIAAHSLQWAAPAFVGEADVDNGKSLFTATNIREYVLPWLRCMRDAYNVTLAWQGGGWNEKNHNNTYIKLLRKELSAGGFASTGVAAADQCCGAGWNIVADLEGDADLRAAVGAVTTHCAGSMNKQPTPDAAVALGVPLYQGEEHIGLPDPDSIPIWEWAAAAATGVEVNQNWVLSNMSATIFWPAAYAWLSGLNYQGKGFVLASAPWGAAPCYVPAAAWVVAHTTHFTTPRVSWLLNGTGSGHITDARAPLGDGAWNVSYVAYATGSDVTLVVESFLAGGQWHSAHQPRGGAAPAAAAAAAAPLPPPATATFKLEGAFAALRALHVWHTNQSATFERLADAPVAQDGTFSIAIEPGAVYTYTSVASAHPGAAAWLAASAAAGGCAAVPPPTAQGPLWLPESPFPLPYYDDFEGYSNDTLPLFTSDMFGAFTVYELPPAAAAAGAPAPLRERPGVPAASVACGSAEAARERPLRCRARSASPSPTPSGNTRVLRQWTRSPPLGWGGDAQNFATIIGNATLGNLTVGVRALIEAPSPAYAPAAPPYVQVGINGGSGGQGSSPRAFYGAQPDADSVWFNASHWGCSFHAAPPACAAAHALPQPFGLDAWHSIAVSEAPAPGSLTRYSVSLDGALLLNFTTANRKNEGRGGYVLLRTGAHRAQFDDLSLVSNV